MLLAVRTANNIKPHVLSLGMEDMLSLAYGAAGNMVLMIITVTAVCLPTEFELSLSLCECTKFLLPLY